MKQLRLSLAAAGLTFVFTFSAFAGVIQTTITTAPPATNGVIQTTVSGIMDTTVVSDPTTVIVLTGLESALSLF